MGHRIIIDRAQNGWIVTDEFNPAGALTTARYVAKDYAEVGEIVAGLTLVAQGASDRDVDQMMQVEAKIANGGKPGDVAAALAGLSGPHLVKDPA